MFFCVVDNKRSLSSISTGKGKNILICAATGKMGSSTCPVTPWQPSSNLAYMVDWVFLMNREQQGLFNAAIPLKI